MSKEIIILSNEEKKLLLEVLGYKVTEEGIILNANNEEVICPFTKKVVRLETASLMPGSLIIMNTTPLTLSEYFYQYPDD